ncbi:MAG: nuclear transport factor 2 family protein [Acidobacteria bacterium]|nr:nuclear transport factor 2 family protein [Candidatus Sulfomarinibacter sp. MAG AM1]
MISISNVACAALLLVTPLLLRAQVIDSEWSEAEQEIWALEERYMTAFKDGDVAGLKAFLHADFLGWPSHSSEPLAKAPALASVPALQESLAIRTVEVRPRAIHLRGEFALVHYLVVLEIEEEDGGMAATSYRITHTWVEEDGRWRILGGMSARVEAEG